MHWLYRLLSSASVQHLLSNQVASHALTSYNCFLNCIHILYDTGSE